MTMISASHHHFSSHRIVSRLAKQASKQFVSRNAATATRLGHHHASAAGHLRMLKQTQHEQEAHFDRTASRTAACLLGLLAVTGTDVLGRDRPMSFCEVGSTTMDAENHHFTAQTIQPSNDKKDSMPAAQEVDSIASKDESTTPQEQTEEEDEPTSCTICLVNRQGPCRTFWRPFEKCMKESVPEKEEKEKSDTQEQSTSQPQKEDQEKEESSSSSQEAEKCDGYMIPWLECVSKYRNTYLLIMNQFYQDSYIDNTEQLVSERILNKNALQLQPVSLAVPESDKDKSADERTEDVVLVEGTAMVSTEPPREGFVLDIAYVRDEAGVVLGFDQFSSKADDQDGETPPAQRSLRFHVRPESAKSVQLFAIYRQEEPTEQTIPTKEEGDSDETRKDNPSPKRILQYSERMEMDCVDKLR